MKRIAHVLHSACVLIILTGCGDYSTDATTLQQSVPTSTSMATPSEEDSPEEVRQAILSDLEATGPVCVHVKMTSDEPYSLGTITVEQLLDREHNLARETWSLGARTYEQTSVVGDRSLTLVEDGGEFTLTETLYTDASDLLDPSTRFSPILLYPLEYAEALSVRRLADGGWELAVRSPQLSRPIPPDSIDPSGAGEPPFVEEEQTTIEVGPDFLLRRVKSVVKSGLTEILPADRGGTEIPEWTTTEYSYRFESIGPLTEDDVRLSLPPGVGVTERLVYLPLDHPRAADASFPHYWLGSEFLGVPLSGALFAVSDLDAAEPTEFISLSYGEWDAPLDEAGLPTAGLIDVQQGPHRAGEPDPFTDLLGMAGPFETEQRVVAGREATVLSRVTEAPSPMEGPPAFEVLVQFPDVTVYLQGGVDGGTVDALLAALQQL